MDQTQRRVLFLVEGSALTGTGHLRRCSTLARHLQSMGWQPVFQVLSGKGLALSAAALENILGTLPFVTAQAALELEENSRPAVVVLDVTPPLQKCTAAWCRAHDFPVLALDYQQPDLLPERVIALADLGGQMRAAYAQAGRAQDYHEGVAYAMMRPAIAAQRGLLSAPGQNGTLDVVVTLGGADPHGLTLEAIELLRTWRIRLEKVTLVMGPGTDAELQQKVAAAARPLFFLTVIAPPDFDQLLGRADLVICNGGGTLLEALCLGRLVAVLPQTPAETAFAQIFCEQKACVWAQEMVQIIETSHQERLEFAQRAASIIDGQGLNRIANVLADLADASDRLI